MTCVKLDTDYFDAYDIWFDLDARISFGRVAKDSGEVSRSEMYNVFKYLGLETPRHGLAGDLVDTCESLVLYTDEHAHCGEGKVLTSKDAVTRDLFDTFSAEYISEKFGITHRLFVDAEVISWFTHESFTDWRSNHEDGDLHMFPGGFYNQRHIESCIRRIKNPVFAIDFVEQKGSLLAIDWNPAPRVSGTPSHEDFKNYFGGNKRIAEAIKVIVSQEAYGGEYFYNNNVFQLGD